MESRIKIKNINRDFTVTVTAIKLKNSNFTILNLFHRKIMFMVNNEK